MGGRGTYAIGNNVPYSYTAVGEIDGVKILRPNNSTRSLKLPEEAHSSTSYILLNNNGTFRQMRIYNKKHEAILEIGYHNESSLCNRKILHVHEYKSPGELSHETAIKYKIGPGYKYYEKYKNIFKEFKL